MDTVFCRRLLWILCVSMSVVLFSVQVVNRISDYFDYKTNVNVEIVYLSSIPFPAVTICNQNSYR